MKKDESKTYLDTVTKQLKTFYRANGYVGEKELRIRPTRYRKIPEYVPTTLEVHSMADCAGTTVV